ncbi:CDH13 isoform 12 [Pongo abelii]|uniref:CDH13 isoform 12 n=1 Tax=Pongo abelii TaxID=9601 RepID=A0A2J8T9V2_PONAB|nr:CDH13 isoform 12 [Pongo abelii]
MQPRTPLVLCVLLSQTPVRPTIYLCQNLQFIKNKARDSHSLADHKDKRIQANRLLPGLLFHDELSGI